MQRACLNVLLKLARGLSLVIVVSYVLVKGSPKMKVCPVCKSALFDDMNTCYECLYHFEGNGDGEASATVSGGTPIAATVSGGTPIAATVSGNTPIVNSNSSFTTMSGNGTAIDTVDGGINAVALTSDAANAVALTSDAANAVAFTSDAANAVAFTSDAANAIALSSDDESAAHGWRFVVQGPPELTRATSITITVAPYQNPA
jgi:hypothetical protein